MKESLQIICVIHQMCGLTKHSIAAFCQTEVPGHHSKGISYFGKLGVTNQSQTNQIPAKYLMISEQPNLAIV